MKTYIKPTFNIIELRSEEVFAAGSGTVKLDSSYELTVLGSLGLDTSIFVHE